MIFFSSRCWELVKTLMFLQTLAHFERQIETRKIRVSILQQLDHSQTLAVVVEPAMTAHAFGQHLLAGVAKRRMSQVVRKGDGFREIFIQAQGASDRPTDRRDFNGMRQARAQMVTGPVEENLRLVLQP